MKKRGKVKEEAVENDAVFPHKDEKMEEEENIRYENRYESEGQGRNGILDKK